MGIVPDHFHPLLVAVFASLVRFVESRFVVPIEAVLEFPVRTVAAVEVLPVDSRLADPTRFDFRNLAGLERTAVVDFACPADFVTLVATAVFLNTLC